MSDVRERESLLLPVLLPVGILVVIGLVLFLFSRILLAISHAAATVVALVVLIAILSIAAFVASRRQVGGSAIFSMVAWVTGVAMVAGGLAVVAAPLVEGEGTGEVQTVALAAPAGAAVDGFSTDALAVGSDVPIEMEFDNADPGVQHNVVIVDGGDAEAPVLFQGELLTGPDAFTYAVDALPEGEFFFFCEVHPTTMTGTMTAAPGGGGGGAGAVTVVASGLAFDTSEIALAAGAESTVTFDNQDAGTPHNIAIYGDDSLGEVLFIGDLVTGVATADYAVPALEEGEYYFQCDVHPDMNGSVAVGPTAAGGEGGGAGEGGGSGEGSAGGEGGGSASPAIAAQGSTFDTGALQFPADTDVTLTFDNQDDASVTGPHNVAIYDGDIALFQGELVDGPATVDYAVPGLPAGTYEFRCDIHPQMAGSVEVA